jgi:hypothetical protein
MKYVGSGGSYPGITSHRLCSEEYLGQFPGVLGRIRMASLRSPIRGTFPIFFIVTDRKSATRDDVNDTKYYFIA